MIPILLIAVLAQTRTETGDPSQSSWFGLVIALILVAFFIGAFTIRRSRRRNGEPSAGSVPASEMRSDR